MTMYKRVLSDVDLDTFLRFNKIRALVDNTELLAKALSKSELLQVTAHCNEYAGTGSGYLTGAGCTFHSSSCDHHHLCHLLLQ